MPTSHEILAILKQASNDLIFLAIVFHILIFIAAIALIKGWRPTKRAAGVALSILLLSVSVIALMYANPFNGVVFAVFFILLGALALKLPRQLIVLTRGFWMVTAAVLIVFGAFYPHFLDSPSAMYLIAAPMGLIPCPTLSVVIGFTLLFQSFNSKRWAVALSIIGLFYGLFGVIKLQVSIDLVLVLGSILLLLHVFVPRDVSKPV